MIEKARSIGVKNPDAIEKCAKFHGALSTLPENLQPKRMHVGINDKVAIIGRKMEGGVLEVESALKNAGHEADTAIFYGDKAISKDVADEWSALTNKARLENRWPDQAEVERLENVPGE